MLKGIIAFLAALVAWGFVTTMAGVGLTSLSGLLILALIFIIFLKVVA